MKKESKILSFDNSKIEELVEAELAKIKGGKSNRSMFGCPPPIGGSVTSYRPFRL